MSKDLNQYLCNYSLVLSAVWQQNEMKQNL